MNRLELLAALADAEQATEEAGTWRLGPNGLERVEEEEQPQPPPTRPRWTGKPRRSSRQGRRGLV